MARVEPIPQHLVPRLKGILLQSQCRRQLPYFAPPAGHGSINGRQFTGHILAHQQADALQLALGQLLSDHCPCLPNGQSDLQQSTLFVPEFCLPAVEFLLPLIELFASLLQRGHLVPKLAVAPSCAIRDRLSLSIGFLTPSPALLAKDAAFILQNGLLCPQIRLPRLQVVPLGRQPLLQGRFLLALVDLQTTIVR